MLIISLDVMTPIIHNNAHNRYIPTTAIIFTDIFSRDWCISRQLWWGHQIPMWKVTTKKEKSSADDNVVLTKNFVLDDDGCLWVYGQDEKEAIHQSELIMKCSDVSVTRVSIVTIRYINKTTWFTLKSASLERIFNLQAVYVLTNTMFLLCISKNENLILG